MIEHVTVEHPDYQARRYVWQTYRDLYVGGDELKARAHEYLTRRQTEPNEVYAERLSRVFYENYVGSIIDWYAATLFRREPVLQIEGSDNLGRRFFAEFFEDCDLQGTSLSDFLRSQFIDCLVFGASHILVDFPRSHQLALSRAQEEELGCARAYLVGYSPENLINWSRDERGRYEWVVLRSTRRFFDPAGTGAWRQQTYYAHYDRSKYAIFRAADEGKPLELVDQGRHGLAPLGLVPLFDLRVAPGLWLMNKAALLQLEHFNKSNALSWALTMGLFAAPVIYSDREWDQVVSESYYIQLGPQDRFGWTEPEGKVFQLAADNLKRLREEIYRVCYLTHQAGSVDPNGASQSGLAKLRDFAVTQEVLRAYGDAVKDCLKRVLRAICEAREDDLLVHVTGLDDFDIADFSSDLEDATRLLALDMGSRTLKQQVYTKLAHKYLCDAPQHLKDQIAEEIKAYLDGRRQ